MIGAGLDLGTIGMTGGRGIIPRKLGIIGPIIGGCTTGPPAGAENGGCMLFAPKYPTGP
jgi:hypothetical protein